MTDSVHQEDYKGYIIKIVPDEDPMDPRDWDNLGTMVCRHQRYNLGDYKATRNISDEEIKSLMSRKDVIRLPMYLYDHSGLRINTGGYRTFDSMGWDWGQVGFIYVTHARVFKEYKKKRMTARLRDKVIEVLEQEVKTYDQYLSGDVVGFAIYDENHIIDSCFGFYGEMEYCLEQARNAVEGHIAAVEKWPYVTENGIEASA